MAPSVSRVTAQNQISIPASVRRRFHIVPGTELVWEERDGLLIVRPKRFTLEDLRTVCADRPVKKRTLAEIRALRNRAVAAKHDRG
jgi:AbrB family looped-hinge helix DNA binding protein